MSILGDDSQNSTSIKMNVMDAIGLVNENPFLYLTDEKQLSSVFEEFSKNVVTAMRKLEILTGVAADSVELADDVEVDGAVVSYLRQSEERGQVIEVILASAFMKEAVKPYFALLNLDKLEKQGLAYSVPTAQEAMTGLKELQRFARVVPAIYKTISQDQGLSLGAVA